MPKPRTEVPLNEWAKADQEKTHNPWTEVPLMHSRTALSIVRAFGSVHFDMVLGMFLGSRKAGFGDGSEDGLGRLEG